VTLVGDGVDVYRDLLHSLFGERVRLVPASDLPACGGMVARLGWERLGAGEETPVARLEPLYVRPSEAERKSG